MTVQMTIQWSVFLLVLMVVLTISIINLRNPRGKQVFLCGDCKFNNDEDCHKKERPQAMICTSYREVQ